MSKLLVAAVVLFGLGLFVEVVTLSAKSRSEAVAGTIEPQELHRHINVTAMPEQRVDDLF